MVKLRKRKPKEDPARERYPEALWPLLSLGQPEDEGDYSEQAASMADHVPDLIRMVLDEELNHRPGDDPAVFAPLHALHVLAQLGAAEAAEPLTACLDWDDEWFIEALPEAYAGIGPVAIPPLQAYLEDGTRGTWGRGQAAAALAAIAKAHPDVREAIVQHLIDFLERPTADDNADEEMVTTQVISELAHLGAEEAYPAIKRAYEEDRVAPEMIGLEDVEVHFGMRPAPDYSQLQPTPPKEPGVRLVLRCKSCGRERSYLFPKVYYDLGTFDDEEKRKKYDPLIIPQRVVCSKCGAVDEYELSGMGHVAILADLLTQAAPKLKGFRREDQHIKYVRFEAMGQKMHPLEAIERYQAEIARRPDDGTLHVGYGNVLHFLGRDDEAEIEYRKARELEPGNPHPYISLANLAAERGDTAKAIALWQRVLEVTPGSQIPARDKRTILRGARDSIEALRSGRPPDGQYETVPLFHSESPSPAPTAAKPAPRRSGKKKVKRNEPCPCGSGKKYKHCCMRKEK